MHKSLFVASVLLWSLPLSAQKASYAYIDQKAPYANPTTPHLVALNLPKLGEKFQVQVPLGTRNMFYGSRFFLATGAANPGVPVPVLGGYLFTSPDVLAFTGMGQGTTTVSFDIPNDSKLMGLRFYQQVLAEVCYYQGTCSLRLSRGGAGVLGR